MKNYTITKTALMFMIVSLFCLMLITGTSVIKEAYHLDENRTLIEDIYENVSMKDGKWSPLINDGEYVRVTFEVDLNNTNDITIFAKPEVNMTNASIDVYEVNGTTILATFENVSYGWDKIYLTELNGSQDTFDLKINGAICFDYIVDPVGTQNLTFVSPTYDDEEVVNISVVPVNITITNASNMLDMEWNWNGTNYTIFNESLLFFSSMDNNTNIGDSSTNVADSSTFGNDGIWNGGQDADSGWTTGYYNDGLEFDGDNDYIRLVSINFKESDGFTISAWVYPNSLEADDNTITGSEGTSFLFDFNDNNSIRFRSGTGDDLIWTEGEGFDSNDFINTWNHLTLTSDGVSDHKLYVNGIFVDNGSGSTGTGTRENVRIGTRSDNSADFDGKMDDVFIWDYEFSAEDVYQKYSSRLSKLSTEEWNFFINQTELNGSGLANGDYTYQAFAQDGNGNWNETEERAITLGVEVEETVINVISPTNQTYTTNTIWFNATSNQNITEWIVNYNGTNQTISINTTLEVEEGSYQLLMYGNYSGDWILNDSIYFSVDIADVVSRGGSGVAEEPVNGTPAELYEIIVSTEKWFNGLDNEVRVVAKDINGDNVEVDKVIFDISEDIKFTEKTKKIGVGKYKSTFLLLESVEKITLNVTVVQCMVVRSEILEIEVENPSKFNQVIRRAVHFIKASFDLFKENILPISCGFLFFIAMVVVYMYSRD